MMMTPYTFCIVVFIWYINSIAFNELKCKMLVPYLFMVNKTAGVFLIINFTAFVFTGKGNNQCNAIL